jgi:hypothetical protein
MWDRDLVLVSLLSHLHIGHSFDLAKMELDEMIDKHILAN